MSARLVRLGLIATLAGVFSGLFGIGGGSIIVPLLILWMGYGEREATGTSLAAMTAIAAAAHALYGNVDPVAAALIGIPAVGGVLAGTSLQQRIPERAVSAVFAVLLVASAIALVL